MGSKKALMAAVLSVGLGLSFSLCAVAASDQGFAGARADRFEFDIPAQSLKLALDAFSATTGLELVYDSSLTAPHWSSGLKGAFTADEGASHLLATSGLTARAVAPGAITIAAVPDRPSAAAARSRPDSSRHAAYFAEIQDSFAKAFCHPSATAPDGLRALVRFRIGSSGALERLEMLGPVEEPARQAMVEALGRVTLQGPPPTDLPQPVMLLILPQARAMC